MTQPRGSSNAEEPSQNTDPRDSRQLTVSESGSVVPHSGSFLPSEEDTVNPVTDGEAETWKSLRGTPLLGRASAGSRPDSSAATAWTLISSAILGVLMSTLTPCVSPRPQVKFSRLAAWRCGNLRAYKDGSQGNGTAAGGRETCPVLQVCQPGGEPFHPFIYLFFY